MVSGISSEFLAGYIEEVQSYIPSLKQGIIDLQHPEKSKEALNEVHRQVHIIKGASSMIGFGGLSELAGHMENLVEHFLNDSLPVSHQAIRVMGETIDSFNLFCKAIEGGENIDEQGAIKQTATACMELIENGIATVEEDQFLGEEKGELPSMIGTIALEEEAVDGLSLTDEFIDDFRGEAEGHLLELDGQLKKLDAAVDSETSITPSLREILRRVRRSIHTVKGASAVVGLESVAGYCHEIENYLDWLFESAVTIDPGVVTNIATVVDFLGEVIDLSGHIDQKRMGSILSQLHIPEQGKPPEVTSPAIVDNESLIEDENQEILIGFFEEAQEHLQEIHTALQTLNSAIKDGDEEVEIELLHRDQFKRIRRCVHTLKGAAAVIGLHNIAGYAHKVEDLLDWLFETANTFSTDAKEVLQTSLDLLGSIIEEPDTLNKEQTNRGESVLETFLERVRQKETQQEGSSEIVTAARGEEAVSAPTASSDQEWKDIFAGEGTTTLRVKKHHVDKMVNLANELLVGVSGFELRMKVFKEAIGELERSRNRLKDIAMELETNFEVKALDDLGLKFKGIDDSLASFQGEDSYTDFDTMELDRYTQLNLIIRSLNEVAVDVGAIQSNIDLVYSDIDGDVNRQRRDIRQLQLQIIKTRMSPLSSITPRLGRTMRDVGAKLGKKVQLKVEGEEIELDRVVWEKLADPFMHLIRNAVHHGIESTEERQSRGKPLTATITIAAQRRGNKVIIRFSDDGQGLNFESIRHKAKAMGMGSRAANMNEKQLTDLIFQPGFSTKTISEISGRGVGLDVVRENIQELQGSILIETDRYGGTDFIITLPLTLGVVKGLIVQLDNHRYGIPVSDIREIRRLNMNTVDVEQQSVSLDGKQVPYYSLATLMGRPLPEASTADAQPLVLIMDLPGEEVVVEIPGIAGQQEMVVKELGHYLQSVRGISGASVLGDGSIVPVLNINDLALSASKPAFEEVLFTEENIQQTLTIMIVDDSISVRRVVNRFVSSLGWEVIEAKDGLEAMEKLESTSPDFILLDVEMPRMNGFEFLSKIRNISDKKDIPIAMLTSRTSGKHREKAFGLGAKGFLNKPYKDEELVDLVTQLTGFQLEDGLFMRAEEKN